MKKEEIYLTDWQRILLGQAPLQFALEVFLRTLLIYLLLLVTLRLLGKRMNGQLTITEMAVMLTLGAIVSVPMQLPDRGILPGVLILACVLFLQRGISWMSFKNNKVERVTQGAMCALVKDGCVNIEEMTSARVSQQQLFGALRAKGIRQLGQVKRVYLESCGLFSIYESPEPRPGLSVLPPDDQQLLEAQPRADGQYACLHCGCLGKKDADRFSCSRCSHDGAAPAVT